MGQFVSLVVGLEDSAHPTKWRCMLQKIRSAVHNGLVQALVLGVRFYQVCLRPILPSVCRFYPSCSEYFIQAVQMYGPWRGSWRGFRRLCRCHPWHPGGYDPP